MSGGAPNPNAEPVWGLFLFAGVLLFVGWIVWAFFRVQMLEVLRYVRLGELFIISLFSDQQNLCYDWLKNASISDAMPTMDNIKRARSCFGPANLDAMMPSQSIDFYNLSGYSISAIGRRVSYYVHWPAAIAFIAIGIHAIFISPRNKFKTRHTLESFIKVQAQMWPVISPIVDFKPSSVSARIPGSLVPDRIPTFAEALSPEEWIAWHRIPMANNIPDREATRRAFIIQLGPRWNGIEGQPAHIRALFAAFSLKGVQRREESDDLLGRLSTCWTMQGGLKIKPDIAAEIERHIRDQAVGGEAGRIAAQHAYRTTAMVGVLKWARSMGGVLASAQFLWVRGADRGLWYPLNNIGRRSYHTEGSGAMAHFMAEQNAKKPLPIPRVDTAIVALNKFLTEPERHPMPIPQREES